MSALPQSPMEEQYDPGLRPCQAHPQQMTRLSCSHCEIPICPKCMVNCEVAFKCKQCANKTVSHIMKGGIRDYLAGGTAAFVAGLVFGYLSPAISSVGYGFFVVMIGVAVGKGVGEGIHRCARYKLAQGILNTIYISLVIGFLASPLHFALLNVVSGNAEWYSGIQLAAAGAFAFGIHHTLSSIRRR